LGLPSGSSKLTTTAEEKRNTRPTRVRRGKTNFPGFSRIAPLSDTRWEEFLQKQSAASVFHSRPWLTALQNTYGYEPLAFTTSAAGEPLRDAVLFCKVQSWLIRPRLVSLPFSDHAMPLLSEPETLESLLGFIALGTEEREWASVELRPPNAVEGLSGWTPFRDGQQFALHKLNLQPSLEGLFRALNKDSTQRKIRKAEREHLSYEEGRSDEQLRKFFQVFVMTRLRKVIPPPPLEWFRNILEAFADRAKIRIATTRDGELAGAILTLSYKDTMIYKYGATNAKYHNLGTMPFLLWKAIEDAKRAGATVFDFGRSDVDNKGLIRFKDHFGAEQTLFTHKVFPGSSKLNAGHPNLKYAKRIFAYLPESAFILAGKLIYPHIG
jgi:CelD/BcsL family acetyltransferase involved in cellulose biosynthesis